MPVRARTSLASNDDEQAEFASASCTTRHTLVETACGHEPPNIQWIGLHIMRQFTSNMADLNLELASFLPYLAQV